MNRTLISTGRDVDNIVDEHANYIAWFEPHIACFQASFCDISEAWQISFALLWRNLMIARGTNRNSLKFQLSGDFTLLTSSDNFIIASACALVLSSFNLYIHQPHSATRYVLHSIQSNSIKIASIIEIDNAHRPQTSATCKKWRKSAWENRQEQWLAIRWSFTIQNCIGMFHLDWFIKSSSNFTKAIPRSRHLQFYDIFIFTPSETKKMLTLVFYSFDSEISNNKRLAMRNFKLVAFRYLFCKLTWLDIQRIW